MIDVKTMIHLSIHPVHHSVALFLLSMHPFYLARSIAPDVKDTLYIRNRQYGSVCDVAKQCLNYCLLLSCLPPACRLPGAQPAAA